MNEVTRRLSSGAPSFPTADRLDVGHFASSIPFLPRSERSEWSTGERSEPDMEEEIIGNRWKELDYDGYCPASCRHPFRSSYDPLHSAPQAAVGERGEPERDGGRQEAEMQRLYSCLSVTSHSPFNRCIHAGRPPLHSPPARFTRPTA